MLEDVIAEVFDAYLTDGDCSEVDGNKPEQKNVSCYEALKASNTLRRFFASEVGCEFYRLSLCQTTNFVMAKHFPKTKKTTLDNFFCSQQPKLHEYMQATLLP